MTEETFRNIRLGIFNVRGLRKRLQAVNHLTKDVCALRLCETWVASKSDPMCEALDETEEAPKEAASRRGYGGVAWILHPLMHYRLIEKSSSPTVQYITIRHRKLTMTVLYISPKAKKEEEQIVLNRLNRISGGKAVIMGDLNSRSLKWDTTNNPRGSRLQKWAKVNGWQVKAPRSPSYRSPRVTSTPDIFLSKGVPLSEPITVTDKSNGGSDHYPVITTTRTGHDEGREQTEQRHIPRSQRSNARIIGEARKYYKEMLPKCLEKCTQAGSSDSLEEAYKIFKQIILQPWEQSRTKKPHRFKSFWNRTLDIMAKKRKKLYRKALIEGSMEAKTEYNAMEKQIKKLVKLNKLRQKRRIIEQMANPDARLNTRAMKSIMQKEGMLSKETEPSVDPADFTKHMATPASMIWAPQIGQFEVPELLENRVKNAIQTAPRNKAVGTDEIFVEALNVSPELAAKIICTLWRKCGQAQYVVKAWTTAILVPIYKKGDRAAPRSYRPISLLSYVRKVIEAALAAHIRAEYTFEDCQLGFRLGTGTETAIMRHINNARRMAITVVLDLRSAYDTVPRKTLHSVLEARLGEHTLKLINIWLQPTEITTQGDSSGTMERIGRGVPQGSPLSPTIFNVYMDTYVDSLTKCVPGRRYEGDGQGTWDVTLFADDVKLQVVKEAALQKLLTASTAWAQDYEMEWSVGKCSILRRGTTGQHATMELDGQAITNEAEAEYLGVTATAQGTTQKASLTRAKKATGLLHMLRNKGVHSGSVTTRRLLTIWKTRVLPIAAYGIHLVPIDQELRRAWETMERTMMISMLGTFSEKTRERLRTIAGQLDLKELRETMMESLQRRIIKRATEGRDRGASKKDPQALSTAKRTLGYAKLRAKHDIFEERAAREMRKVRKLPGVKGGRTTPALALRDQTCHRAAIHWHCGTLPLAIRHPKPNEKATINMGLAQLSLLMKKASWTSTEEMKVGTIIRKLKDSM